MKTLVSIFFIVLFVAPTIADQLQCAICVILLGLLQKNELSFLENNFPNELCQAFPPSLGSICQEMSPLFESESSLRQQYNKMILEEKRAPEDLCRILGYCDRPQCRLWDASNFNTDEISSSSKVIKKREWKWENLLAHLPVRDDDDDYFSPIETLRGGSWRGRDCDDTNVNVYPGRNENSHSSDVDHNCNGIFGTDANGGDYEELLCSNSSQRGVIVLGDSISAHFHIPVPSRANLTLDDLFLMALNEVDYPQCSWATGFATDYKRCSETSTLPLSSFYSRLKSRNRCNHRDYQNISRNGARSTSMAREIMQTTARKTQTDNPAIVFYSMLANDVCNGSNGTAKMTPPEEFHEMVTQTLVHFNGILPKGSHVVLLGLIHGELMWDSMFDKQHFIGATYGALWDFLACLEETACWGWLNGDEAARRTTNEWAESLSQVLRDVAATQQYENFKIYYLDHPDREYHADYEANGGDLFDLYEVMDGGHPSLTGELLLGEYVWNKIEQLYPEILGPINPNNELIEQLFNDQGGY